MPTAQSVELRLRALEEAVYGRPLAVIDVLSLSIGGRPDFSLVLEAFIAMGQDREGAANILAAILRSLFEGSKVIVENNRDHYALYIEEQRVVAIYDTRIVWEGGAL